MGLYNVTRQFYTSLISFGESLQSYVLLAFRLYWGLSFFTHGMNKINDISSVVRGFTSLNIPFPEYTAHLVGWVECLGGACLVLGIFSRLAALPLVITMIVALFTAHFQGLRAIFSDSSKFISQAPVTYLMATLTVLAFGPGRFSLDGFFKRFVFKGK